ncbi:MAG: type II toxin-antitoxin system HicB family antitoxin [Oscillospiraceae bacterium]|nr:type II toxin-antitoxin system HicB family antitoxin [Oscillospiraceae bacterium]
MNKYHINVFYSDDDEGFIADIPDLKFCSAFGDTPQEAVQEVMVALELWLEEAAASNKPIPEPKYKPIIYQVAAV